VWFRVKLVVIAVSVCVVASTLLTLAPALLTMPLPPTRDWLRGVATIAYFGVLFGSAPIGAGMGLVGGSILAWAATRRPPPSPGEWVRGGAGVGMLLGSFGCATLGFYLRAPEWGPFFILGAIAGAICGALTGVAIGAWTARTAR
jgi:hypothetical protein